MRFDQNLLRNLKLEILHIDAPTNRISVYNYQMEMVSHFKKTNSQKFSKKNSSEFIPIGCKLIPNICFISITNLSGSGI